MSQSYLKNNINNNCCTCHYRYYYATKTDNKKHNNNNDNDEIIKVDKIEIFDFFQKITKKRIIFYWYWDHFNYLYDGKEKRYDKKMNPFVFIMDPCFLNMTNKLLKKAVSQQKGNNDNVFFLSTHDICRNYQKGICKKGRNCSYLHIWCELYRRLTPDPFYEYHCSVDNVFLLHNYEIVHKYNNDSQDIYHTILNDIISKNNNIYTKKEIYLTMLHKKYISMLINLF